jgi:outer membrane immunogenic protein
MKRILFVCVSLATLATTLGHGGAADLPRRYDPIVPQAPVYMPAYNWSGFYLGVNGGGGFGRSNWTTTNNFDVSGGLIGGTAGYNWQTGQVVFGLEGDVDWSGIRGRTNGVVCPLGCQTENTWLATVRGRLGYSFDRFMPYVTGGVAFGDIKATIPAFAGATRTETGWTVGAGIEFAIYMNWTAKAEYLYVDLGKFSCGIACGAVTNDVTFHSNIARAGVNYRF